MGFGVGKTPAGQVNKNVGRKGMNYNAMLNKADKPSNSFLPPRTKGSSSLGLGRANSKLQ